MNDPLIKAVSSPVTGMGLSLAVFLGTLVELHAMPGPVEELPKDEALKLVLTGMWVFFGVGLRYYYRIRFTWRAAVKEAIVCSLFTAIFMAWAFYGWYLPDDSKQGIGVLIGGMVAMIFGAIGLGAGASFGVTYALVWAIASAGLERQQPKRPVVPVDPSGIHTEEAKPGVQIT